MPSSFQIDVRDDVAESSSGIAKPWYHYSGQNDEAEQQRMHSIMGKAHHDRKRSGEKVSLVSAMSPETPSMQTQIKRTMTGVIEIEDGSDTGRLTLHSVIKLDGSEAKKNMAEDDINNVTGIIESESPVCRKEKSLLAGTSQKKNSSTKKTLIRSQTNIYKVKS